MDKIKIHRILGAIFKVTEEDTIEVDMAEVDITEEVKVEEIMPKQIEATLDTQEHKQYAPQTQHITRDQDYAL